MPAQGWHERQQDEFAQHQEADEPPGNERAQGEADECCSNRQAVDEWIKDLPQPRDLAGAAGDDPIEVVRDARDREHEDTPEICLSAEDQPEEDGDEEQSQDTQRVGHGDDPVVGGVAHA